MKFNKEQCPICEVIFITRDDTKMFCDKCSSLPKEEIMKRIEEKKRLRLESVEE